jgi:uncharacterized membrane protein YdfJ with MMPL/SSD domain
VDVSSPATAKVRSWAGTVSGLPTTEVRCTNAARLSGAPICDDNRAIETGQAKRGRVIVAAAMIMILVFGSFIISDEAVLKEFGFGLAFSVLIDAFIIRSVFVPAAMHLIGPANWTMPAWLDRVLPNLSVEAEEEPVRV